MTLKISRGGDGSAWNIAQKIHIFRTTVVPNVWAQARRIRTWVGTSDATGYWQTIYPDLPVSTSTPTVLGPLLEDFTVYVNAFWSTEEYRKPDTITYKWQRGSGTSWTDIAGATSGSYILTANEIGFFVRCQITLVNYRGSVTFTATSNAAVATSKYRFSFTNNEFGVGADGYLVFDKTSGVFPPTSTLVYPAGRLLGHYIGDFAHYRTWYKSDATKFRLFRQLWVPNTTRTITAASIASNVATLTTESAHGVAVGDIVTVSGVSTTFNGTYTVSAVPSATTLRYARTAANVSLTGLNGTLRRDRPATPPIDYEIVFTDGSTVVEIYVIDPPSSNFVTDYSAYMVDGGTTLNSYNQLSASGTRWTVTMEPFGTAVLSTAPASTTSPSNATGWIDINTSIDSQSATIPFTTGAGQSSPVQAGVNGAFVKSNMFFPTTPTIGAPTYLDPTSAGFFVGGSDANSYYVTAVRTSDNALVYASYATSTYIVMTGLTKGSTYTITVSPNSRSDSLGQFGFAASASWRHVAPPSAPINVVATPGVTYNKINVTWGAPLDDGGSPITSYTVSYRRSTGSVFTEITGIDPAATSYTITGLSSNVTYLVRVAAVNENGAGAAASSSATTLILSAPSAVVGLAAANPAQGSSLGVLFITWAASWSAPTNNGNGDILRYEFARDLDAGGSGAFEAYSSTTNLSTSVIISNGIQAYFKVRAVNDAGGGTESQITLNSSPSAPGTPTLSAISSTNAQVTVSWNASNANGGTSLSYRVFRSQNQTTWNERTTSAQANTSYNDNIAGGSGTSTTYYYKVTPYNSLSANLTAAQGIDSGTSSALTVTQPTASILPLVSTTSRLVSLLYTLNGGSGSATSNYTIFRGQNTNPVNSITSGQSNVNTIQSYSDQSSLALGTTYYYKVSMTNNINTVESTVESVTTPTAPGQPGRPTGTRNASGRITVAWNASNTGGGGTVSYEVFRGQSANTTPQNNIRVGLTATNFDDTGLNPGSTYYYRVVPSTVWATGTSSNLSAGTTA